MRTQDSHESSASILNVAPSLRADLRFTLQRHSGELCYLVEDERNAKYFRIGIPEYTFISLLDGTTTIQDALGITSGRLGAEALSENDAAAICQWLVESQLAETQASRETERITSRATEHRNSKANQQLNPLMIRLPVWRPDQFVTSACGLFGSWFSLPGTVIWLLVVAYSLFQLATNGERAQAEGMHVFAPANLPWLFGTWVVLKLVHELSHAVACKRFGGHVREAGIMLMIFAPVPYVDVTASWQFASKWQRIAVAAAGMYAELFVAAIAAIVWSNSGAGLAQQIAYNAMVTASVSTVLFNANPLMRFDGYYMLADWLEIPNLYSLGQQYVYCVGRRIALGVPARVPNWGFPNGLVIRCYGVAACIWRIFVSFAMLVTTSVLWHGTGLVLAIAAGIVWFGMPLVRFGKYLWNGNAVERPSVARFVVVFLTALSLTGAIGVLPEPGGVRVPGVVAYHNRQVVRAPFAGFLRNVYTDGGHAVNAGDVLVDLENPEMDAETQQLSCSVQMCDVRSRKYQEEGELAAMQAEASARESLVRKATEQRQRLSNSPIKAGQGGVILSSGLHDLEGTYVEEGTELLSIAEEHHKEIHFVTTQWDEYIFRTHVGTSVYIHRHRPGAPVLTCQVQSLEPSGTLQPQEPALLAPHGGQLAVRSVPSRDPSGEAEYQLLEPHFEGKVLLDDDQSRQVQAGERVVLSLHAARGTVAQWLIRSVRTWVEHRLQAVREE